MGIREWITRGGARILKGGGRKRLCARTHITNAKRQVPYGRGPVLWPLEALGIYGDRAGYIPPLNPPLNQHPATARRNRLLSKRNRVKFHSHGSGVSDHFRSAYRVSLTRLHSSCSLSSEFPLFPELESSEIHYSTS